jgi:hypothetical protein
MLIDPTGFWGTGLAAVMAAPEYGLIVLLILVLLAALGWAVPPRGAKGR